MQERFTVANIWPLVVFPLGSLSYLHLPPYQKTVLEIKFFRFCLFKLLLLFNFFFFFLMRCKPAFCGQWKPTFLRTCSVLLYLSLSLSPWDVFAWTRCFHSPGCSGTCRADKRWWWRRNHLPSLPHCGEYASSFLQRFCQIDLSSGYLELNCLKGEFKRWFWQQLYHSYVEGYALWVLLLILFISFLAELWSDLIYGL